MQKKYILVTSILFLLSITYLFYHSCKRDTVVIKPQERVSIPDSSWLYGSLNFEQLRKDIAWSSILNGDFTKLFQTDTSSNTLLAILKSPSSYSIVEQNNIQYFSICKNQHVYTGLLFSLENKEQLIQAFKSTAYTVGSNTQHSFRTNEGYWLYNDHNLLFIGKQYQDSLLAHSFFNQTNHTTIIPRTNDSTYAVCTINTQYYQDSTMHPMFDSASIYIQLKKNTTCVDIDWKYSGVATAFFNQTSLIKPNDPNGFYLTLNPTTIGLQKAIDVYQQKATNRKKQSLNVTAFISFLQNNTAIVEFNGWKKIKNSFFTSVLNDEFEMVLVKKDSSYLEPSFRFEVNQHNTKNTLPFLTYLHKEGLISNNTESPFAITLGNFDSELIVLKDSTFVYQNKHADIIKRSGTTQEGVFILQLKPAFIQGLKSQRNITIEEKYKLIDMVQVEAFKENSTLEGNIKVFFSDEKHPIISSIQLFKNQSK